MKQIKLGLATITMLSCGISASAHDFEVGGIYYNITSSTDLTVAVTYRGYYYDSYSNEYSGAVTIPETVTYNNNTYSVTSIGESAFRECSSLTDINIPEGVTSIGDETFRGCSSLTSITIPESVTSIGDQAFYYCSSLTAITIPEGVTSIGSYAFYGCSSLASITIPEGVTSIGSYAFESCSSLYKVINNSNLSLSEGSSSNGYVAYYAKVVYKGSQLTTVGDFQFYTSDGIHSLVNYIGNDTEIVLPDSYNGENYKIGDCAFYNCSSLTSITLPEGVTSIGSYAFESCSSLTAITLPEGVTSIGNYAFDNCTALKKVIIEDGSSTLSLGYNYYYSSGTGQGLFYDCPLEEVYLGRNLSYSSGSSYGYSPFYNKDALTHVTIGDEVTAISQYAFYGCDNIHSLTISSGVLSIGSNAFNTPKKVIWLTNTPPTGYANAKGSINYAANDQHSSLSNLRVYPYLSSIFEVDGVKYVPVSPSERTCHAIDCAYDSTAMVINVGETVIYKRVEMKVTEVMPYTFYGNDHIKEVSVSHLGNLGDYAFYDCDGIEHVIVSHKGNIGYQSFYHCSGIKDVNVTNQGNISSQAFYDCDGIKSVEVRNQGYIGSQAFYGCNAMETAIVANEGAVGDQAFSGCSSLKSVTLGDKVTSLGNDAFRGCTSLQEIVIPDSVKSVGQYCFSGCTAMTNVTLGRSVATINNYAFQNCSSLPEITLPQAVTKVGDYVFKGCSKLADVVIADRTAALALGSNGSSPLFVDCPLDSVYIGGKITYSTTSSKGYSPFYRNTSLRSVMITDREEQIYDNEFYGCTNLQNVTIGNGVKSIGNYAFSGCSSLAGFSFGSSMETIGAEAFSDCTNLTSITSHAAVPPTCGTQALDDINKWNCVLGVPLGNADAYYAADQWKEFFFIEDVVEVAKYKLTFMIDGEVYYTNSLVHKSEITVPEVPEREGYTFSGWSEVPNVMPAEDVTISGFFTVNKYLVTFVIDDEVVAVDSLEYGAAIVAPEAPEREGYIFDGWSQAPETMPANDVVIYGTYTKLFVETMIINDAESSFSNAEDTECGTIIYIRNFTNTTWQSLYVPFEIPVTEDLLADFEIADLNDIRQYDRDDDGVKDETVVEAFKVKSGTLAANYPYLIRAKKTGEKTITVTDATLFAAEEVSIDCSSIREEFTFTGTYSRKGANELGGCYALANGEWQPLAADATLGAFRVYLKIESRNSNEVPAQAIRIRVIGEDDATAIDEMESSANGQQLTVVYDLQGRRIVNADNLKGVYIINGKKVVK